MSSPAWSPFRSFRRLAALATLTAPMVIGGAGCASCESAGMRGLSVMRGTINDPQNKSLRRGVLAFGLDRACQEMLARPSALREGGESAGAATNPTNGRFFPKTCTQSQAPNGDLVLSFSGSGYTYATGVHKVTFEASATVQFDQDFMLSGDVLYGYFRTREVSKPQVTLKVIEATLPSLVNSLTGFGENYARQLLSDKLRDGFTIRRKPNSETDFRSGIVELGTWPKLGYDVAGGLTLANDRTEVHQDQRDFLGPFEIKDDDAAITVTGKVDGAPAENLIVVDDATAKRWQEAYLGQPNATPPPATPLQQYVAKQGDQFQLTLQGRGTYWVVLDNTSTIAGGYAPTPNLLDDRAAVVTYAAVLGKRR